MQPLAAVAALLWILITAPKRSAVSQPAQQGPSPAGAAGQGGGGGAAGGGWSTTPFALPAYTFPSFGGFNTTGGGSSGGGQSAGLPAQGASLYANLTRQAQSSTLVNAISAANSFGSGPSFLTGAPSLLSTATNPAPAQTITHFGAQL